ncbi:MAG TPA: hypothetical protein VHD90_24390, partial [Phototrophicaceae bacterium]|nr:hypothetical protein [Phototrophicaceae bacterium]
MSRETQYNASNFNRPPRVRLPSLEGEQIEIPAPNPLPAAQDQNMLMSLIPVLSMSGMALFYVLRADDASLALPMVGIALLAFGLGIFAMRWRRRDQQRQKQEIQLNYLRLLDQIRTRLQAAQDAQIGILDANYPLPADYLHIALSRDMRLWQRRPGDADFASFRVGNGRVPSQVEIVPPPPDDTRSEVQLALNLANSYRFLDDAPVTVPLTQLTGSAIGFCGRRSEVMRAVRAALCHLAVLHSPDDLRIYLAASGSQADEWRWLTWLPHSGLAQSSGGELIAFDAAQIRNLMGGIAQLVDERKAALGDGTTVQPIPTPHLLLIVDEGQFVKLEAVYPTLLREGAALGVSVLCIAPTFEALPGDCAAVVQVGEGGTFQYVRTHLSGGTTARIDGRGCDGLSLNESEQIARALASITASSLSSAERIPQRVDFLSMYGARRVEDLTLKLRARWSRSIPDGILPFPALL